MDEFSSVKIRPVGEADGSMSWARHFVCLLKCCSAFVASFRMIWYAAKSTCDEVQRAIRVVRNP